jgi:hypothetical protein
LPMRNEDISKWWNGVSTIFGQTHHIWKSVRRPCKWQWEGLLILHWTFVRRMLRMLLRRRRSEILDGGMLFPYRNWSFANPKAMTAGWTWSITYISWELVTG